FRVTGLIGGWAGAGDESEHSTGGEQTPQAAPPACRKPMLRQRSAMPAPAIPRVTLGEAWTKMLCKNCIDALVNERASEQETGLAASVKELSSTFQSFKTPFEGLQFPANPSPASQSTTPPLAQGSASSQPMATASAEETPGPSREEAREEPDSATSGSQDESEGENQDGESRRPSRYKLSLDEVEELLGSVYTTLGIQVDKKPLSLHDQTYKGLGEQKKKVFPVHKVLVETVKKEWQDPERKPFFSRSLKRRFPFSDDPASTGTRTPNWTQHSRKFPEKQIWPSRI
ncbi:hypothetical protein AB205_0124080, partial [Aquarana catesbeiana]